MKLRKSNIDDVIETNDNLDYKNKNRFLKLKTLYLIILIILLIFTFIFSFKTGEKLYYLVNTDLEKEDTDIETRSSYLEF